MNAALRRLRAAVLASAWAVVVCTAGAPAVAAGPAGRAPAARVLAAAGGSGGGGGGLAGWAVGSLFQSGTGPTTSTPFILATADGGASWTAENPGAGLTDVTLSGVWFVNGQDGWALGVDENADASLILATTDGGRSWSKQYSDAYRQTGDTWNAITFADAQDGWAVGVNEKTNAGMILATTDGGQTWSPRQVPQGAGWLGAVAFANAQDGWAVGGSILVTTDGGQTWLRQNSGQNALLNLQGLSFANAQDGWAVGGSSGAPGPDGVVTTPLILATTDGGQTWTPESVPAPTSGAPGSASFGGYLHGVDFANPQEGWAVGDGMILATTDGGRTWRVQDTSPQELRSVSFANAADGWVVGDGGTILATTDGGLSWSPQAAPPAASGVFLSGVSFPPSPAAAAPADAVVLTVGSTEAEAHGSPLTSPVAPVIEPPGRTFVPLRFVSEALGAQVSWDGATQQVTIALGGHTVVMTEGRTTYTLDGAPHSSDAAPFVLPPGYTMVPIRFVSQALGFQVSWNAASQTVTIQPTPRGTAVGSVGSG